MKNALYLTGYLSIAFFTLGLVFKLQHWPGAGILLVSGGFFLNIVFLPMLIARKLKNQEG